MTSLHKYGVMQFDGAKVGDRVRFVASPQAGKPGRVLKPRNNSEINGIIREISGSRGYIELLPQLGARASSAVSAESGSASGVKIPINLSAGGSLKIL